MAGTDTNRVRVAPALERIGDFADFLKSVPETDALWSGVLKAELIGRPVGAKEWVEQLEAAHGKALLSRKRGPKGKVEGDVTGKPLRLFDEV